MFKGAKACEIAPLDPAPQLAGGARWGPGARLGGGGWGAAGDRGQFSAAVATDPTARCVLRRTAMDQRLEKKKKAYKVPKGSLGRQPKAAASMGCWV